MKWLLLVFIAACSTTHQAPPVEIPAPRTLNLEAVPACRTGFYKAPNQRRAPPDQFLRDLFAFVDSSKANDVLYGVNGESRDIFAYLSSELGISATSSRSARAAALYELLRVSGAMESSYNYQEGRDLSANNTTLLTIESGIFQTSCNSHYYAHRGSGYWQYLDNLTRKQGVEPRNCTAWIPLMKDETRKPYIFEHHAFMLRHNFHHYGPMKDKGRVAANLSKACMTQIEKELR